MVRICEQESGSLTFIGSEEQKRLSDYVKKNIVSCLKNRYEDFLPLIAKKVDELCRHWQLEVQSAAKNGRFKKCLNSFSLANGSEEQEIKICYLDEETVKMVADFFTEKLGLFYQDLKLDKPTSENSLQRDVLPKASSFSFNCYWTPQSTFVLSKTNPETEG